MARIAAQIPGHEILGAELCLGVPRRHRERSAKNIASFNRLQFFAHKFMVVRRGFFGGHKLSEARQGVCAILPQFLQIKAFRCLVHLQPAFQQGVRVRQVELVA